MKDTKFRTFEIPCADGRIPFKFAVRIRDDGGTQVTRISPYDETEYHLSLIHILVGCSLECFGLSKFQIVVCLRSENQRCLPLGIQPKSTGSCCH